jgi:hypothetical protein
MGSGFPASDSRAATMTSMCTYDVNGVCKRRPTTYGRTITNSSYYSLGWTSTGSAFRYGGTGGG